MSKTKIKNLPPLSLRLTFAERQKLDRAAGTLTISAYIRGQLFPMPDERKRNFRRPVENEDALHQLLIELGRSNLSNNLNQLAKASHKGTLPAPEETQEKLDQACDDVEEMKKLLVQALGLKGKRR
jgi:hypothetical protein